MTLEPTGGMFVGRDSLFLLLESELRRNRVVLLHGQGGIGKTELAKAFARWFARTGGVSAATRIVMHSLEPGVPSFGLQAILTSIALAIGGRDLSSLRASDRRAEVLAGLSKQPFLILLDNFETVRTMPDESGAAPLLTSQEQDDVRQLLASVRGSASYVIVTSRSDESWLGDTIARLKVEGLLPEEVAEYAQALLAPIPSAARRRESRSFATLLDYLDGNPLSLRLVLPHLKTTDPEVLVGSLRGAVTLAGIDAELGGRTQSLLACIDYSFQQLDPDDQHRLVASCLFRGTIDIPTLETFSQPALEAPQRFQSLNAAQWNEILTRAEALGLVTYLGSSLFRMHPALPPYLTGRWEADAGSDFEGQHLSARRAFLKAHAALADQLLRYMKRGDTALAFKVIDSDSRTFAVVLAYAIDEAQWVEVRYITAALREYWDARGLVQEELRWLDRITEALERTRAGREDPSTEDPASTLRWGLPAWKAQLCLHRGQFREAEQIQRAVIREADTWIQSTEKAWILASSYLGLGIALIRQQKTNEGRDAYQKALALYEDLNDEQGLASAYHQLGVLGHQENIGLNEAYSYLRKSLEIRERRGDQRELALVYNELGTATRKAGAFDEAREWYVKSLSIRAQLNDLEGVARSQHHLAMLAEDQGEFAAAQEWLRQALDIYEQLGNKATIAGQYHELGVLAQLQENYAVAREWHEKSLTMNEELDLFWPALGDKYELALIDMAEGRLADAEVGLKQTLEARRGSGRDHELYLSFLGLGKLYDLQGRAEASMESFIGAAAAHGGVRNYYTEGPLREVAWLSNQLGMGAMEQAWRRVVGHPIPDTTRAFLESVRGEPRVTWR
jgi:tetratricopeptide (TPR) repeat protein